MVALIAGIIVTMLVFALIWKFCPVPDETESPRPPTMQELMEAAQAKARAKVAEMQAVQASWDIQGGGLGSLPTPGLGWAMDPDRSTEDVLVWMRPDGETVEWHQVGEILESGGGWAVDIRNSTVDVLVWTKPGVANIEWRRAPEERSLEGSGAEEEEFDEQARYSEQLGQDDVVVQLPEAEPDDITSTPEADAGLRAVAQLQGVARRVFAI